MGLNVLQLTDIQVTQLQELVQLGFTQTMEALDACCMAELKAYLAHGLDADEVKAILDNYQALKDATVEVKELVCNE